MTSCGCGRKRKGVAHRIEHHFRYAPMPEAHPSAMLASAVRAIPALSVCPAGVTDRPVFSYLVRPDGGGRLRSVAGAEIAEKGGMKSIGESLIIACLSPNPAMVNDVGLC